MTKGATNYTMGWGGGGWSFLEINIFVGKMGEINKWPQLRSGENKYFTHTSSGG